MFEFAFLTGIYSYIIFFLGIFHLLSRNLIFVVTAFFILGVFLYIFNKKYAYFRNLKNLKLDKFSKILLLIISFQAVVNLIGVLGPEISFDALWYHLTLPKLYLQNNLIFHIPGGLLYYSDMPKNMEMIYIAALSFGNEIFAKFFHYIFGLLALVATYKLSRKFFDKNISLISSLIFYSSLVIGWQSITAGVDLTRTFFEIVALYKLIEWFEKKQLKHLIFSALMLGFSISIKSVALSSLLIFVSFIAAYELLNKTRVTGIVRDIFTFSLISLLISLPWFLFSYLNTGNPFYPLFDSRFVFNYTNNILNTISLFTSSADPISPVYLILFPLIIFYFKNYSKTLKLLVFFSLTSVIIWYFTSAIGGSRFYLPYLPVLSVSVAGVFKYIKSDKLKNYLIFLILLVSLSSIGYRFLANTKYIPVILGEESKSEFLTKNLNFDYGDFYDTDGFFKKHIKNTDTVLLYGFHNLYYINFNFIDSSWAKKGNMFNYIAVQNGKLPEKFSSWKEIYYNTTTRVKLYSNGGKIWEY